MTVENFYLTLVSAFIGCIIFLIIDMEFNIVDRIKYKIDDYLFEKEFQKRQIIDREKYRKAEKELLEIVKKIDQDFDDDVNK